MNRRRFALLTFLLGYLAVVPGFSQSFGNHGFRGYTGFYSPYLPGVNFHEAFHGSLALGLQPAMRGYPPSYFTPHFWNNYDPSSDPDYRSRHLAGKRVKRKLRRRDRMDLPRVQVD